MSAFIQHWENYRDTRQAPYEFRAATRYRAVADTLYGLGLRPDDSVADIGAGTCQFERCLRGTGWRGRYLPIDAVICGTDLESWSVPDRIADWIVCIEVVEHLLAPFRLVQQLMLGATLGACLTTPNPDTVDVLACDPTHLTPVSAGELRQFGWAVRAVKLFDMPGDSLLAHWTR